MYEKYNKMKYGLVRQLGPWTPTEADIFNFAAPARSDPSDYQILNPDGVPNTTDTHAQSTQLGGGKVAIKTPDGGMTILQRVVDDPRISIPGRRLDINRKAGASRMPIEPGTGYGPLRTVGVGSSALSLPKAEAPTTTTTPTFTQTGAPPPDWRARLKTWAKLDEDSRWTLIKRYAGEFPKEFDPYIPSFTADEKDLFKRAALTYYNRQQGKPLTNSKVEEDKEMRDPGYIASMQALLTAVSYAALFLLA